MGAARHSTAVNDAADLADEAVKEAAEIEGLVRLIVTVLRGHDTCPWVLSSDFASFFLKSCAFPRIGAKLYNDEYIFCIAEVKSTLQKNRLG